MNNEKSSMWVSVDDKLPDAGEKVLATFENSHGKRRTICGHLVPRWTIESDCDDAYDEYSEEKDAYYLREGWYENIENWGDFSSVYVCDGEVTHWMPLPKPPTE